MTDQNYGGVPGGMWQRPEDLVGTVLNDRFRVVKMIGDGGMGSVYLAEHVTLRKKVALKVLKHELCREQTHVDRFLQEARAASMIQHENIVDIVDFGPVPGGSVFFAMEYLEGEDLSQVLRRERRIPWARARDLMLQIVRALKAAHQRGIIHRDLKPANCFLQKRSDGRDFIKLLDFGIAKVTDESGEGGGLTRTGAVFGTAKYMAPEQAMGDPADARTDVYAAAICLYEFLTGTVPFDGDNFMRVLSRHLTEPLTLPSTMAPDARISPVVEAVIVKALSKRPDDRYQSMAELEAAIMSIGPDGRLIGGQDVGPAFIGPGGTQMGGPQFEPPGSTQWLGNVPPQQQQAPRAPSHPPEGRGGTIMLDPSQGGHEGMEPGGTIRLGAEWGTSNTPPPMVHAKPEATYMMDGMGQEVLPQGGGAVITRNPPVGHPSTNPPPYSARGPQSVPPRGGPTSPPRPETSPPTFAPDNTRNPDATVFAVERRGKAGFIAMLVVGAVIAIGGGGLVAWIMLDDPKPPEVAKTETPKTEEKPITAKVEPDEDDKGPILAPVDPPPEKQDPPPEKQDTPPEKQDPPPEKQDPPPEKQDVPPEKPVKPDKPDKPNDGGGHKKKEVDKLSAEDVSKGINKAAGSVKTCKGPIPISIKVTYRISQEGKASVTKVEKNGGGSLSDETKQCVKRAVESHAKFPKNHDFKLETKVF